MDLNFTEAYREHTRHVDGGEIHEGDGFTLLHVPRGEVLHNPIIVHGPVRAPELLDAARRLAGVRDRRHCVFFREGTNPALDAALDAAGWRHLFDTPGMALAAERWAPRRLDLPGGFSIRPVRSEAEATAYGDLAAEAFAVYGVARDAVRSFFTRGASLIGAAAQGYLGWIDGAAVTGATLYASHGVAGVGWVGTHPSWFGRRLAEAVTAEVLRAGFARGLRLANLQASPMGRGVYARMGFEALARYKVFLPPAT